ncbi:MAG: CcoQ/FixQ family Cbb3-type cytochrome c oxidase assembly chaperone [Gammaproteobacteria bacterium]|nr:MAG: CcoQ/FixQ family Cbb3-type cytochrome c oxidase assembly chaperone [Gammaproteobacteria bacterium]
MTLLLSVWTVLVLVTFLAIVAWAWSGKRREDFERAARIPLDDDDAPVKESNTDG